jgi:hypothetical protein
MRASRGETVSMLEVKKGERVLPFVSVFEMGLEDELIFSDFSDI